uniref:Uncharacterized protein n=1 Tax=Elaeophora elaphi TaxID=1147741 RepID=A0A0R3RKL6_9BILA
LNIDIFIDSDRVQLNFPHQECERGRISERLVPITQSAIPPIPVVFPTSRTFFLAPSTRILGNRINDSQATGARSSLRNRAKSIFSRSCKEYTSAESCIVSLPRSSLKCQTSTLSTHKHSYQNQQQQSLRNSTSREPLLQCSSHHAQQNQSLGSSLPSSPYPKTSLPHSPSSFDKTTLSSPTYLQALLESSGRNCKDTSLFNVSKPIKYIKIHYGPSHPSSSRKQQPLRARTIDNVRSSNSTDSFQQHHQQETANQCDYRKYLRSTHRNRINNPEQRITLIATVPDETIFMRGNATCRVPRPSTLYSATTTNG